MKFKLDENLDPALTARFLACGHEADTARGEGLNGRSDEVVYVPRETPFGRKGAYGAARS